MLEFSMVRGELDSEERPSALGGQDDKGLVGPVVVQKRGTLCPLVCGLYHLHIPPHHSSNVLEKSPLNMS